MTVDVIDTSLHVSAFPTTYTGSGTLIGNCISSGGDETDVHGYFTSDGNAVNIMIGFRPLEVEIINNTDGITWKWQHGMTATDSVKVTLGGSFAGVLDTSTAITITDLDTGSKSNYMVTLSAGLVGTSKLILFKVEG